MEAIHLGENKSVKSDIQIAQESKLKHIKEVAESIGLTEDDIEYYGKYKAKITYEKIHS
ncbi:formate--tetrahydrofolate ligase [Bacillus sporothermodurans]|nr:formate--tetrahydrofolate ligase [Heyndrickxia sporothermodurans]